MPIDLKAYLISLGIVLVITGITVVMMFYSFDKAVCDQKNGTMVGGFIHYTCEQSKMEHGDQIK